MKLWSRAVSLVVLAAGAVWLASAQQAPAGGTTQAPPKPRSVIVLRHAEKSAEGGQDPQLSERGRERAAEVARLLGKVQPTAIYASTFRRTQETVAPLAAATGVSVTTIPAAEQDRIIDACAALDDGQTLVVCGHSNTVPKFLRALGAEPTGLDTKQNIPDEVYTRLYIVTLPPKSKADAPATAAPQMLELALAP